MNQQAKTALQLDIYNNLKIWGKMWFFILLKRIYKECCWCWIVYLAWHKQQFQKFDVKWDFLYCSNASIKSAVDAGLCISP